MVIGAASCPWHRGFRRNPYYDNTDHQIADDLAQKHMAIGCQARRYPLRWPSIDILRTVRAFYVGLLDGLLGAGMMKLIVSQWIIPENSLRLAPA